LFAISLRLVHNRAIAARDVRETARTEELTMPLRSVRDFLPDAVPEAVVDDLLEVARWSGSARNRQPWEFVVVHQPETLAALAAVEGTAAHLAGASVGIVLVMAGEELEQEIYDEGRLAERIMLAAAAHGVGGCIGWFKGTGVAAAKAILNIPEERRVRTVVSLGYADMAAHRARPKRPQPRKPLADLVHRERYQ
jgi:nitroreductase